MPEPTKLKDTKQPKRTKDKVVLIEPSTKTNPDPKEVTMEDISDLQPLKNQSYTSHASKENLDCSPKNNFKSDIPKNSTHN